MDFLPRKKNIFSMAKFGYWLVVYHEGVMTGMHWLEVSHA
jgi:hypothetical protein